MLAIVSTKHTELSNMANTRQLTTDVPLPSKQNMDSSSLAQNWKKFRRQFENYAIATRLNKEEREFQFAVCLATIGQETNEYFQRSSL